MSDAALDPTHAAVPGAVYGEDIAYKELTPSTRVGGWCGARQRRFLEAIADGETVRDACGRVGMSVSSAYALRRRPAGAAFDLGWRGADLLARERVAADLLARATEGQEVRIERADGSAVVKHHYDNRLAVTMLNRLDRYADAAERTAPGHAARLVASDFDGFLDLVGADGGPARAGLYMLARDGGGDAAAAELGPVLALARADRALRCGTATGDVDTADLDPARRAGWTAEQWLRAEAAGIVALAPPPAPEPEVVEHAFDVAHRSTCSEADGAPPEPFGPVFWCDHRDEYRTGFPPPPGFWGQEDGRYGDPDYSRPLTPAELAAYDRPHRLGVAAKRALAEVERDRFFALAGVVEGMEGVEPEDVGLGTFDQEALGRLARLAAPADESDDPSGIDATSASAAGGSAAPERPNPFDVTGQGRPCPAPGAHVDDGDAEPITTPPPHPGEGRGPVTVDDEGGLHACETHPDWTPACAGVE